MENKYQSELYIQSVSHFITKSCLLRTDTQSVNVEDPANEYNKVPQSIDKQYLIWDRWPNIHDGMLPCSKGDKACE